MTALKLDKFGGMLPAWDTRLLPDGQADYSLNCYLFSGALIGWRQPKLLHQLTDSARQVCLSHPQRDTNNTDITAADSYWMEFADPDTTVMRTAGRERHYQRYYWASPTELPKYNTYDRIVAGQPPGCSACRRSGCTPGVVVAGGGSAIQVGFTTVDAGCRPSRLSVPATRIFLMPIVPDGSMLVQRSASCRRRPTATVKYQAVVYSDLNGKPYQLLGTGDEVRASSAGTAATSTFTNGVGSISNTTYWLGISHDDAIYVPRWPTRDNQGAVLHQHLLQRPARQHPRQRRPGRPGRCGPICWVRRCSRRAPTSTPG